MSIRIVIPLRSFEQGKSRLSGALQPETRAALVERMFRHVESVARDVGPTYVVSSDPAILSLCRHPIVERGAGLNQALEQAADAIGGKAPILVLSADLPLLDRTDLLAMLRMLESADVVAAPDRPGVGTNALLLARPKLIAYAFGIRSLAAHRMAAEMRGLSCATCRRPGLATDVDWPEDLVFVPGMEAPGASLDIVTRVPATIGRTPILG